jgi:hypothetical protein
MLRIVRVQYLRGCQLGLTAALLHDSKPSPRTDNEDSILSSDSKIEKKKSGMQAMNTASTPPLSSSSFL